MGEMSLFITIDALDVANYNHSLTIDTRQESRYLPPVNYELLIIGSFGEVSKHLYRMKQLTLIINPCISL